MQITQTARIPETAAAPQGRSGKSPPAPGTPAPAADPVTISAAARRSSETGLGPHIAAALRQAEGQPEWVNVGQALVEGLAALEAQLRVTL